MTTTPTTTPSTLILLDGVEKHIKFKNFRDQVIPGTCLLTVVMLCCSRSIGCGVLPYLSCSHVSYIIFTSATDHSKISTLPCWQERKKELMFVTCPPPVFVAGTRDSLGIPGQWAINGWASQDRQTSLTTTSEGHVRVRSVLE